MARTYTEGDRIVLPAVPEEDVPREEGVIEEVYTMAKPRGDETFLIVRVDAVYRQGTRDDGLREVSVETLEEGET